MPDSENPAERSENVDYLTVKQVAELKGCSERYIKRIAKERKIECIEKPNPANGHYYYLIPVSALPENLQEKYYRQKRTETGILPEKKEPEKESKTGLKYGSKGIKKAFESFSEKERQTIRFWADLLETWQAERSNRKDKTEFDKLFVAHQKYLHPDLSISTATLYRKYAAYQSECYAELLDSRGKWSRGTSLLPDDSLIWQAFWGLYSSQNQPTVSQCYRSTVAFITAEHPELVPGIPNEACFRRKIKKIPFAVLEYSRHGNKAMHDHCLPYAVRLTDEIDANSIWVMDNYTFDVIIKEDGTEKTKRMYLTTVLDVKSGVLVGWNITDTPDSQSTLLALRFAILRFGVPEYLYFDNGREFVTGDIVGEQTHRHISDKKKGNLPTTILQHLGIKIVIAIPTNAQAKLVERIHRTIKEQYCRSMDGFCGGTILERKESLKRRIKNGDIETERELRESFADYADNVFNVAAYRGHESRYKGMTAIEVWNASIADVTQRTATEGVLDLLLMRSNGFQKVKREGVFVNYKGEKIWYYDENVTWRHIHEEVCVRYNPDDLRTVRIYDRDDRYLYTWNIADWALTDYIGEKSEVLAEVGRKKAHVRNQIIEAKNYHQGGEILLTQQEGMRYCAEQNQGRFHIEMSSHVLPITSDEPFPKAVGAEDTENQPHITLNLDTIIENAKKQKG